MTEGRETGLEFVTIEGLLAYGEALARCPRVERVDRPQVAVPEMDRAQGIHAAVAAVRQFVARAQAGFMDAAAYRASRRAVIERVCRGDELLWYAAWNRVLAEGGIDAPAPGPYRPGAEACTEAPGGHRATGTPGPSTSGRADPLRPGR